MSSKTVQTVSSGFIVEGLSVAVLVNRQGIAASLGDKSTPEAIDKAVKDIEQLVSEAAGLRKERGDTIKISVVDFVDSGKELEPVEGPTFTEQLMRQSGSLVSAGTVLLVAILLIWFGLRPATKALLASSGADASPIAFLPDAAAAGRRRFRLAARQFPARAASTASAWAGLEQAEEEGDDILLQHSRAAGTKSNPQKQLEQLVDYDEAQAAAILKQWIRQGENA